MYPGLPGKWTVTLTVEDSNRQTDTVSQLIIFNVAPRFVFEPAKPESGQKVTFNASSTIIYFQNPQPTPEFFWSFGDGSNATGAVVGHAYAAAGVYRVSLSVVTGAGNATISKTIMVSRDPPVCGGGQRGYEV
jgi:PKD repeat protein